MAATDSTQAAGALSQLLPRLVKGPSSAGDLDVIPASAAMAVAGMISCRRRQPFCANSRRLLSHWRSPNLMSDPPNCAYMLAKLRLVGIPEAQETWFGHTPNQMYKGDCCSTR